MTTKDPRNESRERAEDHNNKEEHSRGNQESDAARREFLKKLAALGLSGITLGSLLPSGNRAEARPTGECGTYGGGQIFVDTNCAAPGEGTTVVEDQDCNKTTQEAGVAVERDGACGSPSTGLYGFWLDSSCNQ